MRIRKHPKLRWLGEELLHILLTFIIGIFIATTYHEFVVSKKVRDVAEKVCVVYGKDEQECKSGIENILNESDGIVDNNINISGE